MIGGPTDVVVEANIVRATAPARDAQPPRAPCGARHPAARGAARRGRHVAAAARARASAPRVEPPPPRAPSVSRRTAAARGRRNRRVGGGAGAGASPPAMPPPSLCRRSRRRCAGPRAGAEPLAGLADELARVQPQAEPASATRPASPEARPVRREPRMPRVAAGRAAACSSPLTASGPCPPPAEGRGNSPADQNLAEMAQRLEARCAGRRRPKDLPNLRRERRSRPMNRNRSNPRTMLRHRRHARRRQRRGTARAQRSRAGARRQDDSGTEILAIRQPRTGDGELARSPEQKA